MMRSYSLTITIHHHYSGLPQVDAARGMAQYRGEPALSQHEPDGVLPDLRGLFNYKFVQKLQNEKFALAILSALYLVDCTIRAAVSSSRTLSRCR